MKQLIILIIMCLACLTVKAQVATTDYIYSSDGFEVKEGFVTVNYGGSEVTFSSTGIYSRDGKILVAAVSYFPYNIFYVLDGCETICSGAFQAESGLRVYIPSSVKYIAPDAIISRSASEKTNRLSGIQDGCIEQSGSTGVNAPVADPDATEVARYNVQGVRLTEPVNGVNIVQKSDGTAEKLLIR